MSQHLFRRIHWRPKNTFGYFVFYFAIRLLFTGAVVTSLGLTTALASAGENETAGEAASAGTLRLLLLNPEHPVRLELNISIDRKPFQHVWHEFWTEIFQRLDVDQNGWLTASEAELMPPFPVRSDSTTMMTISLADELARQCQQSVNGIDAARFLQVLQLLAPPITLQPSSGPNVYGTALFHLLDQNDDEQLDHSELAAAASLIRVRDFNDDEYLSAAELIALPDDFTNALTGDRNREMRPELLAEETGELLESPYLTELAARTIPLLECNLTTERSTAILVSLLRQRYEKMEPQALAAIAQPAWLAGSADLKLAIALGNTPRQGRRSWRGLPDGWLVTQRLDGSYQLEFPDAIVALQRNNRNPVERNEDTPFLSDLDTDQNGYLDREEVAAAEIGDFPILDRNRDFKVQKQELHDYYKLFRQAQAVSLVLEYADEGRQLFDLLDENGDRRLSIRELQLAADILSFQDVNQNGTLEAWEVRKKIVMEISRGGPEANPFRFRFRDIMQQLQINSSDKVGPPWFQQMDHNGDGDLSVQEFLGPIELFHQYDRDQNRLLDINEAGALTQMKP